MKRLFFLLLLVGLFSCAYCQGERSAEKALFKRITAQDSGFLLKKEVMQISAIVNIIDSVNKVEVDYEIEDIERRYKEGEDTEEEYEKNLKYLEEKREENQQEKYKNENDTIAKYYKRDNGNYIIAIQYYFLSFYDGSNVLIEFSPQGKLLKKEIYYHCYYGTPCGNFNKHEDFFSLETYTCGYGGTFDIILYLFKEITTKNSLNRIPFVCWLSAMFFEDEMTDDKYKDMTCYGKIKKLENDSLIISYAQEYDIYVTSGEGRDIKSELLETIKGDSFDVLYIYKNNQWRIASQEDYEKLSNFCYDMNIYLEFK